MSETVVGYVITATRDDASRHYLAFDAASGGYPWWSNWIGSAQIFATAEDAASRLARWMNTDSAASTLLHGASGADRSKPERVVTIATERLVAESVCSAEHRFSIPNAR